MEERPEEVEDEEQMRRVAGGGRKGEPGLDEIREAGGS